MSGTACCETENAKETKMKHLKKIRLMGITAALAAMGFVAAGYIQAGPKTSVQTKFELTPETEVQMACINGSVTGGVGAVQKRYWPVTTPDVPAVREFNERAAEVLSEDRVFNEALGGVCQKLQTMAKSLSQARQE